MLKRCFLVFLKKVHFIKNFKILKLIYKNKNKLRNVLFYIINI